MPRNISFETLQEMLEQNANIVLLSLLTVTHQSLSTPIRIVNNTENITSGGEEFLATSFEAELPSDTERRVPTARITVSNIDQRLITALRSIASAPLFTLAVVNADTPDTYEYGPIDLVLRDYQADANTIRLSLSLDDFTQEGFPNPRFDPVSFPGLF